ncbi:hypothetical protein LINPERPRIM_LOCUS21179 [Linum perenne]
MAAMCGGSAGGEGGDDGRQPNKERRDSWNCHMIEISAINKANRAKQKIYHTSGSKSILAKGKELETVERFMEDPTTHNHISSFDAVSRAFHEKEHSGRVRGLSFGPTPSQV